MKMRFGKRFLTGLLTAALVVGAAMPALAADAVPTSEPAEAYLNKYLKMADGTATPNAKFTFTFEAVSDSADEAAVATAGHMPASKTVEVTAAEMTADGVEGNLVFNKKISEIFSGSDFKHAGEFTYKVTETGVLTEDSDTQTTEKLTNDESHFTLRLYVVNGDNGPEVDQVTVQSGDPDAQDGKKLDPSDKDPSDDINKGEEDQKPAEPGNTEGFTFVNSYEKQITKPVDPKPEDPTNGQYGALGVTKTVTGKYGDKTAKFPFTMTMTLPANSTETEVTGTIYNGKTATSETVTFTFAKGGESATQTFELADGESLVFATVPSGLEYTVGELLTTKLSTTDIKNIDKYTPTLTLEGSTAAKTGDGTKGADCSAAADKVEDTDAENNAHYTNAFDDTSVTPTGIVINNLPYFLMIMVAAAGIILYETKKRVRV